MTRSLSNYFVICNVDISKICNYFWVTYFVLLPINIIIIIIATTLTYDTVQICHPVKVK